MKYKVLFLKEDPFINYFKKILIKIIKKMIKIFNWICSHLVLMNSKYCKSQDKSKHKYKTNKKKI